MKIQNIVLPQEGICTIRDMFFRKSEKGVLDFGTYFNSLSIEKWKKYTDIKDVDLMLRLKGCFIVTLLQLWLENGEVKRQVVHRETVETVQEQIRAFRYHINNTQGILAFELEALDKESYFTDGWYEGLIDAEKVKDVKIAVNICTYRREAYVLENLNCLKQGIFEQQESEFKEHLKVYITDNGKSLPIEKIQNENIHIVENKNVGGAGGFARGLLEIAKDKEAFAATHVLFMDDDIVFSPETLFRTYTFLKCRKKEYHSLSVGGAMLRMDQKNIQVESGASWNAGKLISNKKNKNLTQIDQLIANEEEEYTEYNAWWYCCIPMSVVRDDNLPLPIFIRGDDVEYGLRNMQQMALLNGICVWHEPFEKKESPYLRYYIIRNLLYDNAIHFPKYNAFSLLRKMYGMAARDILRQRYQCVELIYRGINDFLKGVEFLRNTDGEKLHQEILQLGKQEQQSHNPLRLAKAGARLLAMTVKILFYFRKAMIQFQQDYRQVTNQKFWQKYLEIEE